MMETTFSLSLVAILQVEMSDLGLAQWVMRIIVSLGHSDFKSLKEIQVEILE